MTIGIAAFSDNAITELTLQTGVTTINSSAFERNSLTSVTIPDSVTSIAVYAFALQNPWGGRITDAGNSPYLCSAYPAEAQRAYDSIWYVRLYTQNPAKPNHLSDGVISERYWMYSDDNNNGTGTDSLGGHLINPVEVSLEYVDSHNAALRTAVTAAGQRSDSTFIPSYLVKDYPVTAQLDPNNPTPTEQAVLAAELFAYYRIGQNVSFTAPDIAGYITPSPATRSMVLGASTNTLTFVYGAASSTTGTGSGGGSLAHTGLGVPTIAGFGAGLIAVSGAAMWRLRKR